MKRCLCGCFNAVFIPFSIFLIFGFLKPLNFPLLVDGLTVGVGIVLAALGILSFRNKEKKTNQSALNTVEGSSDGKFSKIASDLPKATEEKKNKPTLNFVESSANPQLSKISIVSQNVQLELGQVYQFNVKGVDRNGCEISVDRVEWQATGGHIDCNGLFTVGKCTGVFGVEATVGVFQAFAQITVVIPVQKIQLIPERKTPRISESDIISASNVIRNFVSISKDSKLCSGDEAIFPQTLRRIEISNKQVYLKPEEDYTFKVFGFDKIGNRIKVDNVKWHTTAGASINENGIFRGGYRRREVVVTATVGELKSSAEVTLLPVLQDLQVSPEIAYLKPGQSQTFTVQGFDRFDRKINPDVVYWEALGGEIDSNGKFTANSRAKGWCQVCVRSYSDSQLTQKQIGVLLFIEILSQLFTWLISFDTQIQDMLCCDWEEEAQKLDTPLQKWVLETQNKLILRLIYSINSFCIEQALVELRAFADVEILPVLRHLSINPADVEIDQNKSIQFTVSGLDQCYHKIEINETIYWSATGGKIDRNGILSVGESDSKIRVTARVGEFEIYSQVTVNFLKKPIQTGEPTFSRTESRDSSSEKYSNYYDFSSYESSLSEIKSYRYSSPIPWFYQSQLFYDGYFEGECNYDEYLRYQDFISFIEYLPDFGEE